MDSLFDDVFNDLKKEVSLKRARFAKDDSDPGFSGSFETSAVSQSSFAEENEFRIKKERLEVECAICFKSFQNEQLLQNHQISSHNYFGDELAKQFSYECSQCDRVFISKQHLNQHIQNECGTDAKPTTIDKRMKGLRWGFESSHPIWKMFKRHVDEVDQLYGICNICGRKLKTSRGTTSGLWWHLRNCHPDDFISTLQAKKAKKLKEAQNSAFVDKVLKEKSAAWEKTEPLDLDNSTLLDVKPKMESVNMTPQARRQYSPLWKWFERHWEDDENRYAICHTCRKEINTTQGSTTALWKHLKKHHTAQFIESYRVKKISAKIKLEDSARIQIALKKENWVPELRRRNADVNVKPELRTGVVEVGSELLTFLMASNLPFSFVDSAPFRRFVAFLNPKYVLKTSPELANSTCDELFKKYQDKVHLTLKEDLLFVDGVSFTQKTVRNSVGNRFMVTTVHYADKNFNVKKFAIDCYKIENDGNKQQMNRIVGSIPELKESSMKTLVCHDQTEAGDTKFQLQTLVCLGKVVDDIVAAAVKRLRTFDDIFERCKKLMSTLGSAEGSKMIKKFGNMCKDADTATDAKLEHEAGIKTDLKSEVEQQVGSHGLDTLVNQLKRIINLRPILERIHREEPESLLAGFTSADFLLLNELLMLLDEFFTMLTKLSENQSFNIHLAVALIFNLQAILQKQKGLTQEMAQNFCRFLRVEVENRFPNLGTQITPFAVANFLNPYYKGCFLRRFPSWQSTKNYLAKSLSNFTKATERRSEETEQGSSSNFQDPELNEADRWSLDFFGDQTNQSKSANEHSELQNEIKNYLDVSPRPSSSRLDPLQWWKQNEMEMPLLASLARKHLSIPPACSREGEVTLNFVENFEKLTILRENNLEYKI